MEKEPKLDAKQIQAKRIADLEIIMSEWKKMPDSRIELTDYSHSEKLEPMIKNKFRGQYFTNVLLRCERLAGLIYADNKEIGKKLIDEIKILNQKVNKQKENEAPITEDLIDETDNFAKALIEKIKYEQNQN